MMKIYVSYIEASIYLVTLNVIYEDNRYCGFFIKIRDILEIELFISYRCVLVNNVPYVAQLQYASLRKNHM